MLFVFLHGGNKKRVQQFDKKIPWKARRVNSQKAQSYWLFIYYL
jgi:hypothetical protein